MDPTASSALCARHPQTPAVDTCQRCGSFVCGACLELREGKGYCPDCYSRAQSGPASTRAIAALVLGIVGLNCGFLPGIVGLVLSVRELAAIDRGEAPDTGRSLARGARVLGWINVALLVIAVAGIIIVVVRGRGADGIFEL